MWTTVTLNIFPYAVFTDSAFYAVALTPDRGIQEFYECLYDKISITPDIILDLVKNFGIVIQGISKNKVLVWQDQIDNSTYRAIMQKYPNAKVDKFTGNIIFK